MKDYYEIRQAGNRTFIKVSDIKVVIIPSLLSSSKQATIIMGGNVNLQLDIEDGEALLKFLEDEETN